MTTTNYTDLIQQAVDAKGLSYSPYSTFRVGSAALLEDGTIVQGANIENAAYAVSVCAERNTLIRIKLDVRWRGQRIVAMAVSSDIEDAPCTPCGVCRQAMREFCTMDMPIFFPTKQWVPGTQVLTLTLEQLLPNSFGPEALC